ncbi:hypothetical protein FJTKL_01422 [Diaporthe vaccinii]|uniref:Zn(2)-C6 fungal-type domain-containing protein n=1 Tax=Diaporthe vaccinii TaxID=105482 RepID=A0ABR4E0R3_9PEZI
MDTSQHDAHGTTSKRVIKACHHCRQKRLKCTTAQYPCPNCQLYGAECVYPTGTTASRRRRNGSGGRQRTLRAVSNPPYSPTPSSVLNRLDPTLPIHPQDADNPLDGILPQDVPPPDDLMDFWNETLDLSCAVVFEGLQPSSNSTAKGPASQTSLSQRGNREAGGKVSGVESLVVGDSRGYSKERILPGLFIRKDTVNSNFIGLNSTGATIAFCMRESLKSTPGLSGTVGLDFLIEAGVHVDEAGVPKSSVSDLQHLPEKSAAWAAIEIFFNAVHPLYPVIDKSSFSSAWPQLYEPNSTTPDRDLLSVFFLVVAVGNLNSKSAVQNAPQAGAISQSLYQKSWDMLQDSLAVPNVSTVQILLLHSPPAM